MSEFRSFRSVRSSRGFRLRLFLTLTSLLFFICQAPSLFALDSWDPGDDTGAGATDLGTPTTTEQTHGPHTLGSNDRYDWYRFSLVAGKTYNFKSTSPNGNDDYGELFSDSSGATRVAYSDDDGGNMQFSITYTPSSSSYFYLRARAYTIGNAVTYTLYYKEKSGDDWDPGDDVGTGATALGAPTTSSYSHGPHTLSSTDRYDWFSFTLTAGNTYNFYTTGGTGDNYGELFSNSSGTTLVTSDDNGGGNGQFSIVYTATTGGTYYLRVSAKDSSGAPNCSYYLYYSRISSVARDSWDPGDDTGAGATDLGTPTTSVTTTSSHTLSGLDQYDWFKINLTAGTNYNLGCTDSSSNTYGYLSTDSAGSNQVAYIYCSSSISYTTYTPTVSGVYYLEMINGYTSGPTITYTISYYQKTGDNWDPTDDTGSGATTISPTTVQNTNGPHTLNSTDLYDWFKFTVSTTNRTYYLNATGGSGDILAELFIDSSGTNLVASSGGTGQFSITYTAPTTGVYYLRVRANTSGSTCAYTLSYRYSTTTTTSTTVPAGDAWDPTDNTAAGATALSAPTTSVTTHGPHTLTSGDQYDWFSVQLTAGQTYNFNTTGGSGDNYGELYSSSSGGSANRVAFDDDSGGSSQFSITYTASTSGTYYLRVKGYTNGTSCSYSLNYSQISAPTTTTTTTTTTMPGALDAWDPGDDTQTGATVISSITTSEQSHGPHTLSISDRYDWYSFQLVGGHTYNFNSTGGTGDDVAELYSSSSASSRVAYNDDGGSNGQFSLTYTAPTDGTYYLRVKAYDLGANCSYSLKYSQTSDTTTTTTTTTTTMPNMRDAWDPGDDTVAGATLLSPPTTTVQNHGPHTLSNIDLYDWYKVWLVAGQTFNFNSTGGNGDNYAELFSNSSGTTRVAYNDDGGGTFQFGLTYTAPSSGYYYLRVRAYNLGFRCSYTLNYSQVTNPTTTTTTTTLPVLPDAWDPGDNTAAGATVLTPTTTVQSQGPHTLSGGDYYDWFSVQLTAGKTYNFNTTGGSGDNYGELYSDTSGSTSKRVAYDDDRGGNMQFRIVYTPVQTGTYYLRVRGYSVGSNCSYSLNYSVAP